MTLESQQASLAAELITSLAHTALTANFVFKEAALFSEDSHLLTPTQIRYSLTKPNHFFLMRSDMLHATTAQNSQWTRRFLSHLQCTVRQKGVAMQAYIATIIILYICITGLAFFISSL